MGRVSVRVSVPGLAGIKQDIEEIEIASKKLKDLVRELDRKIYESGLVIDAEAQETSPKDEITVFQGN